MGRGWVYRGDAVYLGGWRAALRYAQSLLHPTLRRPLQLFVHLSLRSLSEIKTGWTYLPILFLFVET